MRKWLGYLLIFAMSISGLQISAFADREFVGETVLKNNMLFINGNSIQAAQLPNEFVYLRVDDLEGYGFDVEYEHTEDKKIYRLTFNGEKGIRPMKTPELNGKVKVYTTNAQVYIDSDIPANVFELENGTVLVQSDEFAKYGTYKWDADNHTISINLKNNRELLPYMSFQNAIGIDDINDIKYGVIVDKNTNECADIDYEDLRKWLDVYWDFTYDRVVAPASAFSPLNEYIKLWNEDKSKSYVVYFNGGVIVGGYGEPCQSHGEIKRNYIWYLPYIGNGRNALYIAYTGLRNTYFDRVDGVEYKGGNKREFTLEDDIEIPQGNLLITDNASLWAVSEIERAAACNLMVYELSDKYMQPITRYEFCKLIYRLVATEFEPDSDSRMGVGSVIQNVLTERGIFDKITFSDCSYSEVEDLAAMGIIEGMGDGTFLPDEFITREQAATLLCRAAEFLGNKTIPTAVYDENYSDTELISDWALSSVAVMKEMGIMQGVSETEFAPKQKYTAEQAIVTMLRLYECK